MIIASSTSTAKLVSAGRPSAVREDQADVVASGNLLVVSIMFLRVRTIR